MVLPSLDETPTRVFSEKGVQTPGGTTGIELGGDRLLRGTISLADSGESLQVKNQVDGTRAQTPRASIVVDGSFPGVGSTLFGEGNQFRFESFGGNDLESKTVSGDEKITIQFTEVFSAYITAHKWRGTQGKMHFRVIDTQSFDGNPTLVFTSESGPPTDFDNPTTPSLNEFTYITTHPYFLVKDQIVLVEWFSADGNPMTMLGETIGGDFVPFFDTEFCDFVTKPAATQEYASHYYGSTGFTGGTTDTILSDTVTPVKIAGAYSAGNLRNFEESAGVITYKQEELGFVSPVGIPFTADGRGILRIEALATIPQTTEIETDVIEVGIYRNGILISGTLKSKISGVSFGRATPKPLDFHMAEIIEDTAEGDAYDVRILNTSNAINIAATDCKLRIGF